MNHKEVALDLIKKALPHVYCYMGSGFLTGTYNDEVALDSARQAVIKTVTIILEKLVQINVDSFVYTEIVDDWHKVGEVIKELTPRDIWPGYIILDSLEESNENTPETH